MLRYFKKNKNLFCKAPFNTLFFSVSGDVYMCLKNKKQLLGKYPENTIKEIIESKKLKSIQQDIAKGVSVDGCEYCHEQTSSNRKAAAQYNLWHFPVKKHKPAVMEFELSNRCNLACIMCNENFSSQLSGGVNELEIPYDGSFIAQITPYLKHLHMASFRGGEPFLISCYYTLWETLLKDSKAHICVTTNATVWNDRIENLIRTRRFHLSVSVDTFNRERFLKIRKKGDFDLYMSCIKRFVELYREGWCSLKFCVCFMTENRFDMPDLFSFCEAHRIPVHINYVEVPQSLSVQYLPLAALTETRKHLVQNGSQIKYNKDTYDTLINFLAEWESTHSIIEKKRHISEIIKNISSLAPSFEELQAQKDILTVKLRAWPDTTVSEKLLHLLHETEIRTTSHSDFLLLCYLLNQIPPGKLAEEATMQSPDNLKRQMDVLLSVSKEKFGWDAGH